MNQQKSPTREDIKKPNPRTTKTYIEMFTNKTLKSNKHLPMTHLKTQINKENKLHLLSAKDPMTHFNTPIHIFWIFNHWILDPLKKKKKKTKHESKTTNMNKQKYIYELTIPIEINGHAPWRAAGARGGDAPQEERRGRKRSCPRSRHGREDRRSWSGCTWRGNCPSLSAPSSSRSRRTASASHSWAIPSPSTPWSRCRISSTPFVMTPWERIGNPNPRTQSSKRRKRGVRANEELEEEKDVAGETQTERVLYDNGPSFGLGRVKVWAWYYLTKLGILALVFCWFFYSISDLVIFVCLFLFFYLIIIKALKWCLIS